MIRELESKSNKIQDKKSELQEKRKTIKIWNIKAKNEIDREMEELIFNSACCNFAILMLYLYEDSLRPEDNRNSMDDEKVIQRKKEAEAGKGFSKLIIFCHKCFIDHTIEECDLKRLEIEAKEGDRSSACILFGYNMFFAD